MDVGDLPDIILVAIIGFAVLWLSVPLFSGMVASSPQETFEDGYRVSGDRANLDAPVRESLTVQQSLGDAARLDGSADSYVSTSSSANTTGNFTFATWVRLQNTTGTRIVYTDIQRTLLYNGSTGEFVGVYYNSSTGTTYAVREVANSPTTWTHIALAHNTSSADDLVLYENNSDTATTSSATTATYTGNNLNGSLEETRVFDTVLNSSQRQQLISTPTAPLADNRSLRVMYDSYDTAPSSYPVLIAGGSATVGDISVVSGFAGQSVAEGTDYSLVQSSVVETLTGGTLEDAPIVYASFLGVAGIWGQTQLVFTQGLVGAFGLFPTAIVLSAVVFVLGLILTLKS